MAPFSMSEKMSKKQKCLQNVHYLFLRFCTGVVRAHQWGPMVDARFVLLGGIPFPPGSALGAQPLSFTALPASATQGLQSFACRQEGGQGCERAV